MELQIHATAAEPKMHESGPDLPRPYDFELDPYGLDRFTQVAARFSPRRFGYVVTPNVDHLIRLHDSEHFRSLYRAAAYVLLDSRLLAKLLRLFRRQDIPVCTGSDLTRVLFERVIRPDDRIVLIGASTQQANTLRQRYGLGALAHHNPPMGFIRDAQEVERCLDFVEARSPFRFCLLAVGSPQQEVLAHELQQRGKARGLALCVGASIDFLTGGERRAPEWMQHAGLEWLYRMTQNPQRLAQRYLRAAPRLLGLLLRGRFMLRGNEALPGA
jgi:exopolysaccharide biosynthesis WecB/TagA/CpsF family protein